MVTKPISGSLKLYKAGYMLKGLCTNKNSNLVSFLLDSSHQTTGKN